MQRPANPARLRFEIERCSSLSSTRNIQMRKDIQIRFCLGKPERTINQLQARAPALDELRSLEQCSGFHDPAYRFLLKTNWGQTNCVWPHLEDVSVWDGCQSFSFEWPLAQSGPQPVRH